MVQLGRPAGADPRRAETLADGLRLAASGRGHQPAITVLGAGPNGDRRDEQSFASLAQWTAKGAHLLEVDAMVEPGDRIAVLAPPGWLTAAVQLAAWWVGGVVTDDVGDAVVAIVHEDRADEVGELPDLVWSIGDALDGSAAAPTPWPSWAIEVQAFPDQPPMPRATAGGTALVTTGTTLTQAGLLDAARSLPARRLGVAPGASFADAATCLAARVAGTGDPVVVAPPDHPGLEAEQVHVWA